MNNYAFFIKTFIYENDFIKLHIKKKTNLHV